MSRSNLILCQHSILCAYTARVNSALRRGDIQLKARRLSAAGFEVYDIGIDVSAEKFVQSIAEREANILGMSALLTSTAKEMKTVIETLVKAGLRDKVKVMVGGGALTADYAQGIGADGYSPSATGAVDVARDLVGAKG